MDPSCLLMLAFFYMSVISGGKYWYFILHLSYYGTKV